MAKEYFFEKKAQRISQFLFLANKSVKMTLNS